MRVIKKIVMLGTFKTGSLENYFFKGFVKQGISVQVLNIESDHSGLTARVINRLTPKVLQYNINRQAIQFCKEHLPDVIFVCKGMSLFPQTIQEIKQYAKLVVNYNPDHPYNFYSRGSGNQFILDSIVHYDIFLSYSSKVAADVEAKYKVASYCIPFGFDQEATTKHAANQVPDISNSFLFFGAWDNERALFLDRIQRNDLEIFGDAEWRTKTSSKTFVQQNFQDRKLYGEQLYNKVRSDLGVINLLREQNLVEGSHNMRTFEVPGYGGLLMSQYTDEQASFFTPDVEAVYFSSVEELCEKMDHLKGDLTLVSKIKKSAFNRCIASKYAYDERCKEMTKIFSKHL